MSDVRPDSQPDEVPADEVAVGEFVDPEILDVEVVEAEPFPTEAEPFPTPAVDTGYTAGGVPTFESVREKIETRYGTAIGASELAAETSEGLTVAEQYDARQRAAADRLARIRESMGKPEDESQ